MSNLRELAFDWLFNASVQIGLFAILAALLSPWIAKTKAKFQHCIYLAILALCLAAPAFNTFWLTRPSAATHKVPTGATERSSNQFWSWNVSSEAHESIIPVRIAKTAVLALWPLLLLYQLIHFSRGIYRVHRLRRDASSFSLSRMGMSNSGIEPPHGVVLLQSTAIDDPVTVGLFHPAILLPSKLIPDLDESDLSAILAHEYGHIRRRDYLVHFWCQSTTLPVAWHPGIQYLMSKISQTRELACDEYAAVRLGKRIAYARTLLRLASLCLQVPRSNAMELGIFDGDNLEDRIMMLTEKKNLLSRAGLVGLALATTLVFGSSAVIARAVSLQEPSASTNTAQMFAGTWHWMFQGHSFATMILVPNGSDLTGSVTGSKITLDNDGELSHADPSDSDAPSPITKTRLEGNALHVTVTDANQPFEFVVTLKDRTHAEIHPVGAPSNMKPIQAGRAQ